MRHDVRSSSLLVLPKRAPATAPKLRRTRRLRTSRDSRRDHSRRSCDGKKLVLRIFVSPLIQQRFPSRVTMITPPVRRVTSRLWPEKPIRSSAIIFKDFDPNKPSGFKLSWFPTPPPGSTGFSILPSTGPPGAKSRSRALNFHGCYRYSLQQRIRHIHQRPFRQSRLPHRRIVPPDATRGPIAIVTPARQCHHNCEFHRASSAAIFHADDFRRVVLD
jgi:hypothetical protein